MVTQFLLKKWSDCAHRITVQLSLYNYNIYIYIIIQLKKQTRYLEYIVVNNYEKSVQELHGLDTFKGCFKIISSKQNQ